jgi:hypothetical protein
MGLEKKGEVWALFGFGGGMTAELGGRSECVWLIRLSGW